MTVEANAKVNLTLEVYGKRPDGYHALRSLVAPISLADTLDFEPTDDGTIASDTGYADDLCVKAADALRNVCVGQRSEVRGQTAMGARIRVIKRIPAGGGLGGGSADAAATLRALNELWRLGKTPEELAAIGAAVGSDVPALVLAQHSRSVVLMEGRGERVTPVSSARPLHLVVVHPNVFSSTGAVYAACTPRAAEDSSPGGEIFEALRAGDAGRICASLRNDLQEPAVRLHPEIGDALSELRSKGVRGALMSGSGSCVFGIVPDAASASRLADSLRARGRQAWAVTAGANLMKGSA